MPPERRRTGRIVRAQAHRAPAGQLAIIDLSSFGCCIRHTDPAIGPGHFIGLSFAALGTITGYVRWREGGDIGVEFCRALAPQVERAMLGEEPLEAVRRL